MDIMHMSVGSAIFFSVLAKSAYCLLIRLVDLIACLFRD
jgi:hypothetical protein